MISFYFIFKKLLEFTLGLDVSLQIENIKAPDCSKIIRKWAKRLGRKEERILKSMLMGLELAYTVENTVFTPEFAWKLKRFEGENSWRTAVSLAKIGFRCSLELDI